MSRDVADVVLEFLKEPPAVAIGAWDTAGVDCQRGIEPALPQLLSGQLKMGPPLYPSVHPVTLQPAALAGTAAPAKTTRPNNAATSFLMIVLLVWTSVEVVRERYAREARRLSVP
jgi:hypothetical protein